MKYAETKVGMKVRLRNLTELDFESRGWKPKIKLGTLGVILRRDGRHRVIEVKIKGAPSEEWSPFYWEPVR